MWTRWLIIALMFGSVAHAADEIGEINAAIGKSIRWQEHWFGQSFGSACVKKRFARGADIIISIADSKSVGDESGRTFVAYVEGSNVIYSGRIWPSKAVAEPSAGDPDACAPGEIAPQVSNFSRLQGAALRGRFELGGDEEEKTATEDEARRIVTMVVQSLKNYFSQKGVNLPQRLRLGRYRLSDPFLIVMSDEDNHLYKLDLPPIESITDHTVVNVYDGAIFLGPDTTPEKREHSKQRALSKVRKESELLR